MPYIDCATGYYWMILGDHRQRLPNIDIEPFLGMTLGIMFGGKRPLLRVVAQRPLPIGGNMLLFSLMGFDY
jgi:phytoene dehydrogenase-like protein